MTSLTRKLLLWEPIAHFLLHNKPLLAKGIGDEFEPIELSLKSYRIVLVKPSVSVPTSVAYSLVTPVLPEESVRDTVSRPVEEWRGRLINDFEESVFARFPEIGEIADRLYEQGAVYAFMSGSGSRYSPYSIKKSILPIVIRGVLFGLEFVKYSV